MKKNSQYLLGGAVILATMLGHCGGNSSSIQETTPCTADHDCPTGKYCAANKLCAADCTTDKDCSGGRCSARGKCYGMKADSGPGDGSAAVADGPPVGEDSRPPDQKVPLWDVGLPPDTFVIITLDGKPTPDKKITWPDLFHPDTQPAGCSTAIIGKPCTSATELADCGSYHVCFAPFMDSDLGFCTCPCTPDDPSTGLYNEDSCPGQPSFRCLNTGSSTNVCFETCNPKLGANDCQGDLSCHPQAGSYFGSYDQTVCLFPKCQSNADCPVVTQTVCSVASQNCSVGESCLSRAGGDEGLCAKPGKCDLASGLCGAHSLGTPSSSIGDPCLDDTQCAGNMTCLMEFDEATFLKKEGLSCQSNSECCSGECLSNKCTKGLCLVKYRNGYCTTLGCQFASTLSTAACGSGATCNILYGGGICQKTCSVTNSTGCRNHPSDRWGDYECRAWNNLGGSDPFTSAPVCDFGASITCADIVTASSGALDCTVFGTSPNQTQMDCRTLDGQIASNKADPFAFCYDTTASGSQYRSPIPTP